jgi:hypothetical protein
MVSRQSLRRSSVAIDPGIAFVRRRIGLLGEGGRPTFSTSAPVERPLGFGPKTIKLLFSGGVFENKFRIFKWARVEGLQSHR